jgi:hypothetical protein
MRQVSVFTLLFLLTAQSALALCKLNIKGHNICTSEKALLVVNDTENPESLDKQYEVVTIKKHIFRERTAIIKGKESGEVEVHLDELVGNKLCEDNDTLCKGSKVVIREECIDPKYKSKYKVNEKFENDVVELSTGGLFFSKSFLADDNCLDSAK